MQFFKKEVKQQERSQLTQDSRIIVRIWTSERNKEFPGQNVGHVSLETFQPAGYMSLWPQATPTALDKGAIQPVPHEFKANYAADLQAERRRPELTICLYSLNLHLLHEAWQNKRDNLEGWTLIGSNKLINSGSADSCSGMAYHLLEKALIYELISKSRYSKTFSSVVTPDDLGNAVRQAKIAELEQFPETAAFNFVGETQVEQVQGNNNSFCNIL
jgi:hypothetical protein